MLFALLRLGPIFHSMNSVSVMNVENAGGNVLYLNIFELTRRQPTAYETRKDLVLYGFTQISISW